VDRGFACQTLDSGFFERQAPAAGEPAAGVAVGADGVDVKVQGLGEVVTALACHAPERS